MSTELSSEITRADIAAIQAKIEFPKRDPRLLAWKDFKASLVNWHVWCMLAYQDIKLRYRRSVLGPFWITLSMAITVYSMGYLYGHLFHTDMETYFPFLVAGMIAWALISTTITDLLETFTLQEAMLKQIKLPYSLYVHRVVARNMLIFLHNIVVIIPVLILFHRVAKVNINTLLLIPGLFILYVNALAYGIVLAIIGARYRDVSQIVKSLVQVVFFLTPILWRPDSLPADKVVFVESNPFYGFIQLIRAPLMGDAPTAQEWAMVAIMTIIGVFISYKMFVRYRGRIVYWL